MKRISISDKDYNNLIELLNELESQPRHAQAAPRYWTVESDRKKYNCFGEGEYHSLLSEEGDVYTPEELAADDPELFHEFLEASFYGGRHRDAKETDLSNIGCLVRWIVWLEHRGWRHFTYDMVPMQENNPSLFLEDVREYIVANPHRLGKNPHTFADTIHRMPRMSALVEILGRIKDSDDLARDKWNLR